MTDLDYTLIKRLQAELGRLRQEDDLRAAERRTCPRSPARTPSSTARRSSSGSSATTRPAWLSRAADTLAWEARQDLVEALEARLFGAGSLQPLLDDENVENIDINGFDHVFVEYADGTTAKVRPVAGPTRSWSRPIQTLAAHEGLSARAFDVANPRVNLRLPDGSRLYAVQSVTREPVVSIRRHRHRPGHPQGPRRPGDRRRGDGRVPRPRSSGPARTSWSRARPTPGRRRCCARWPPRSARTSGSSPSSGRWSSASTSTPTHHPNAVAFEERLPNSEGAGAVTMAELVRDSLRMNPSRVIVGEVLGDEIVTMLNAMSQGNDGSLSTIHANSSSEVFNRIATYAIQAPERLPWEATVRLVATALDFIVFIRRVRGEEGQRRVVESDPRDRRDQRRRTAPDQRAVGPGSDRQRRTTTRRPGPRPGRAGGGRLASQPRAGGPDGHARVPRSRPPWQPRPGGNRSASLEATRRTELSTGSRGSAEPSTRQVGVAAGRRGRRPCVLTRWPLAGARLGA